MKKGDIVTIYQFALFQQAPEGEAKLIRLRLDDPPVEYWEVEFLNEPGSVYYRCIKKENNET